MSLRSAGAVADEISSLITEKILDGKIGKDVASFVGASVGKVIGDSVEFAVDYFDETDSGDTKIAIKNDETDTRIPNELK